MKYSVLINCEFIKYARSWDELSRETKLNYIRDHQKTKKRLTPTKKRLKPTYLERHGILDGRSYLLPNHPWGVLIRNDSKLLIKWSKFINKHVNEHETYKDLLSNTNDGKVWAKAVNDFKKTNPITTANVESLLNKFSDQISGGKTMDYLFEKYPGTFREKIIMPVLKKVYNDVSIKEIVAFAKDAIIAAAVAATSLNLL